MEDFAQRPPRQILPAHSAGRKQLVAATSRWQRFVEAMGRILAPEG
jgi:hypothetical protein